MCCEDRVSSTHTLRVSIYSSVDVSLPVYRYGCGRPRKSNRQMLSTHVFLFCSHHDMFNPFALGVCERLLIVMAKYSQESHITTVEEVKDFFNHIVYDLDINFHPDDDFKNYVSYETGSRTMDDEQAELYNRLMDESFEVCGEDVYEIGSDLLFKRLQLETK